MDGCAQRIVAGEAIIDPIDALICLLLIDPIHGSFVPSLRSLHRLALETSIILPSSSVSHLINNLRCLIFVHTESNFEPHRYRIELRTTSIVLLPHGCEEEDVVDRINTGSTRERKKNRRRTISWIDDAGLSLELADEQQELSI